MGASVCHDAHMVTVRLVEPSDHTAVRGLADRLSIGVAPWRDPSGARTAIRSWVDDALESHDPARAPVLVAVESEQIVGFATGGERVHWSGAVDAYIGELVTQRSHEGRGIGAALVDALVDWARSRGYTRITLETGAANGRARAFYARRGFETEEVVLTRSLHPDPAPEPRATS